MGYNIKTSLRLAVLAFFFCAQLSAQNFMDYFLLEGETFDSSIPTPEEVLGFVPGEWHVTHDQLVTYMYAVAEASDRVEIKEFGRTHENRPQVLLTISTPQNLSRIDELQEAHLDNALRNKRSADAKPVVLLGYSIHGNEASGSNAALLSAYYLAASSNPEVMDWLEDMVILLDPCFNPDGLHRFSTWVNSHKSKVIDIDKNSREHNEVWPGGRTNHYWFDLNRDWLLTAHPESINRLKVFHAWKPNVLTDAHEMGTNATYFFQPGEPSRNNPSTPAENFSLTHELAKYHSGILDDFGSLYYSAEGFDDFYIGKGSTYPDVNGAIGILFEQASARGHKQESINGPLSFPFAIRNQFATTISTLRGTHANADQFIDYQRDFYESTGRMASQDAVKGYVFGGSGDFHREKAMIKVLKRHQIEVYPTNRDLTKDGHQFKKGEAFVVPSNQQQYRLIKEMFTLRTTFTDSIFYDVSTWTLPLAFNIPYAEMGRGDLAIYDKNKPVDQLSSDANFNIKDEKAVAYGFDWNDYYAPHFLDKLLQKGYKVKVAKKPFTAAIPEGQRNFNYGTMIVLGSFTQEQKNELEQLSRENQIPLFPISTGLTSQGIDLGSANFRPVNRQRTALVVGEGVYSYEAGEVWHLFDQRMEMPLTLIDNFDMPRVDLSKFDNIVLVNGNYSRQHSGFAEQIKKWVRAGGNLVTMKSATEWAVENGLLQVNKTEMKEEGHAKPKMKPRPFHAHSRTLGAQEIGGMIVKAQLDLSHPLAYGFKHHTIPLFRNHEHVLPFATSPIGTPLRYDVNPLWSGYISKPNLKRISGSAGAVVGRFGKGSVVGFADNPNFRGFWYGTNKLFMNAIRFGSIM